MTDSTVPQTSTTSHPLQFKWTLWHDVAGAKGKANYAANLREVASFDTVEDFWAYVHPYCIDSTYLVSGSSPVNPNKSIMSMFLNSVILYLWRLFNNLKEPSQLVPGNTYNLFKHGIEPKWEDPQNSAGGEWRVSCPASRRPQVDVDQYWVNTILTVIGEGFAPDESDDIAGIVLNIKIGTDRIAIWTKSALDEDLQKRIGRRWRETTNISPRMEYMSFKDAMATNSRRLRFRYFIEWSQIYVHFA